MNSRQWLGGRQCVSPGEKKLRFAHQPLDEQTAQEFSLYPGPTRLGVVFRQAAQAKQAFEMLKSEFDLPADPIHLQNLASVQHVLAHRGEDDDKLRELECFVIELLSLFDRLLAHLFPSAGCRHGVLAYRAQSSSVGPALIFKRYRPVSAETNGSQICRTGRGSTFRVYGGHKESRWISPPARFVSGSWLRLFDLVFHPVALALDGDGFGVV